MLLTEFMTIIKSIPQKILSFTFLMFTFSFFHCQAQKNPEKRILSMINFKGPYFDQIVLSMAGVKYAGEAFNSVAFIKNGKSMFQIDDQDGYDSIYSSDITNEATSDLILVHTHGAIQYVVLWGFEYGCCPRKLTIIKIDQAGFKEIFKAEFGANKVALDKNDGPLFYGQLSYSQGLANIDSLGLTLSTYSPILVYNLRKDFVLDSALTKKYNEENYVFAGYKANYKIIVARQKYDSKRSVDTIHPYIFKRN